MLFILAVDDIPPIVTCPPDITQSVSYGAVVFSVTWSDATATDASGIASLTPSRANGSFFAVDTGPATVIYTAIDNYGNIGTCFFSVTVISETGI